MGSLATPDTVVTSPNIILDGLRTSINNGWSALSSVIVEQEFRMRSASSWVEYF